MGKSLDVIDGVDQRFVDDVKADIATLQLRTENGRGQPAYNRVAEDVRRAVEPIAQKTADMGTDSKSLRGRFNNLTTTVTQRLRDIEGENDGAKKAGLAEDIRGAVNRWVSNAVDSRTQQRVTRDGAVGISGRTESLIRDLELTRGALKPGDQDLPDRVISVARQMQRTVAGGNDRIRTADRHFINELDSAAVRLKTAVSTLAYPPVSNP